MLPPVGRDRGRWADRMNCSPWKKRPGRGTKSGRCETGRAAAKTAPSFACVLDAVESRHVNRLSLRAQQPAERPVFVGFLPVGQWFLIKLDLPAVPGGPGDISAQNLQGAHRPG